MLYPRKRVSSVGKERQNPLAAAFQGPWWPRGEVLKGCKGPTKSIFFVVKLANKVNGGVVFNVGQKGGFRPFNEIGHFDVTVQDEFINLSKLIFFKGGGGLFFYTKPGCQGPQILPWEHRNRWTHQS